MSAPTRDRRWLLVLLAAFATIMVCLVALLPPTPANADTPGCVTRAEYRAVDNGWAKARVHRRFDTAGWWHDRHGKVTTRRYLACPTWVSPSVFVMFRGGRVVGKVR